MHAIAMMMSIALRFIPILIEETDKIMKAQMARGADFEDGNLIQKAKSVSASAPRPDNPRSISAPEKTGDHKEYRNSICNNTVKKHS